MLLRARFEDVSITFYKCHYCRGLSLVEEVRGQTVVTCRWAGCVSSRTGRVHRTGRSHQDRGRGCPRSPPPHQAWAQLKKKNKQSRQTWFLIGCYRRTLQDHSQTAGRGAGRTIDVWFGLDAVFLPAFI